MMYNIKINEKLKKQLKKLEKKNPLHFERVFKKAQEIKFNPDHYKNLKKPQQHLKRVHIDSSFVLLFSVDEEKRIITLEGFEHHDEAYKN